MSGSPMDPERLESLFGYLRTEPASEDSGYEEHDDGTVRELLLDRDHWEAHADQLSAAVDRLTGIVADRDQALWAAEADLAAHACDIDLLREALIDARAERDKYRARCPVTAEDVEAAGVTEGVALAWCRANEYRPRGGGSQELFWTHHSLSSAMSPWMHPKRMQWEPDRAEVAGFINAAVAHGDGRSAFDILDEMAKGAAQ